MPCKKLIFDFYGFLDNELFENGLGHYIGKHLSYLTPHEIYDGYSISDIRKCGKKYTMLINAVIDEYRREHSKHFCECGEPLLDWYEFCPCCGKEKQNV